MGVYYIDGEYVSEEEAVLPVTDMAVLRGYGVFDFMRTYGGRPFHLQDHIRRLKHSAALVELGCPWSAEEITAVVSETLRRNDYEESGVRIVVTGGDSPDSITPVEKPRLMVLVTKLTPHPEKWYRDGVKIVTADLERYLPAAKSTNYTQAIVALRLAKKAGAIESIYLDRCRRVLEGTTTNFFAFIGGKLATPDAGILPGITRQTVLKVADGVFELEERKIAVEELRVADEIFISASTKEIVPVVEVDDIVVGDGRPGASTLKLMALFREYTDRYARGKV